MTERTKTTHCSAGPATGQVLPFRLEASFHPEATLTFTWEMLEQQLADLAVTPAQKALAPTLVSGTRKQACFKPPAQVLREVLCIASVLMDETFHSGSGHSGSGHSDSTPPKPGEGEIT
jgi:hypothetical protein